MKEASMIDFVGSSRAMSLTYRDFVPGARQSRCRLPIRSRQSASRIT